ncbi:MAG: hypothetical protein M0Z77_08080 [Thermoplasmatales archaeon]|nr:hypothetical protein [Thermoplasmatales archaeon]
MPNDDGIDPKLAEAGFFKTVHDYIELAMTQYFYFFSSPWTFDSWHYKSAVSSLNTLYNAVIIPHNINNPEDEEVKDFQEEWKKLDGKYGNGFELGLRRDPNSDSLQNRLRAEFSERYTLVMTYLNTLGISQLKQRGENWQDEIINARTSDLK